MSGNRVTDYLTSATANRASQMFKRAAVRAARAIEAPSWRRETAIWRSPLLLGSRFPAYTGS